MSKDLYVGIDYGDLDLRVAYAHDGVPTILPLDGALCDPGILFDPFRNISSLGVGFPSVLQSVGVATPFVYDDKMETPESLVEQRLGAIAEALRGRTGEAPTTSVIAVPAALSQRRRQILLEAAKRASLGEVSLVDRSIAVALGVRTDKEQSGTFMVFSLDYGVCEYSLARLARGRCLIVDSGLAPAISGEGLDALVMQDIVLALRDRQIFLGLKRFTSTHWHNFRRIAESARVALAKHRAAEIRLTPELIGTDGTVIVRVMARRYALAVKRYLDETLDDVNGLVERAGIDASSIDAVLLVGDVATDTPVRNIMWDAYQGRIGRTDEHVVALGAVVCACDVGGDAVAPSSRAGFATPTDVRSFGLAAIPPDEVAEALSGGAGRFAEVVRVEGARRPAAPVTATSRKDNGAGDRITQAQKLVEQGQYREAEALITTLTKEISDLTEQMKVRPPTRAQQLILQAHALVVDGLYLNAVQLTHRAYAEAPHDPAVFAGMMKVHADVGLALNRPEQYGDAIQILTCAHGHDQTDRLIHKALAERHYMQALELSKLSNVDQAIEITQRALTFDPKHSAANELLTALGAR